MSSGTTAASVADKIAQVVLDIPQAGHFDFAAPGIGPGDVGRMAIVPMGASRRAGLIVGIADSSQVERSKLRALLHIQRAWPALGERDLALLRFCAGYYHAPLGVVALAACPPAMRTTRAVHLDPDFLVSLTALGLREAGSLPRHAARLRGVVEALADGPRPESLLRARQPHAAASIRALVERGWVARAVADPAEDHASRRLQVASGPTLNADQQAAFDAVRSALGQPHACLLDGITGSGKTEVYLRLVAETLQRGSQALILLPEINLTPQFLQRIEARFPDARIRVQHSGMADGARLAGYLDAQTGVADVVIGTRLAVFTPMPRLGLIVVDEEHDASFKQETGLRYSARDLAMVRAREAG
ncbi:MAG TPA: DEAD/DEAH box helicase, partial [Usitatibacteraceae bacterium]|nr:DEAD/DEAH box helicase [Usitatibacteraceae bacterium]